MKKVRSFVSGFACALLLIALVTSVFAFTGKITISNSNVKVNGETMLFGASEYSLANGCSAPASLVYTDEKGGGTTYLPVRKISELLGVPIEWDSASKSILIYTGTTPSNTQQPSTSGPQQNQTLGVQQTQAITTVDELASYLNTGLGPIQTAIGTYTYNIRITENTDSYFPQDFTINTEFIGGMPWSDLKYSLSYTDEQKAAAIQTLREFQQNVYSIAASYFPNKKITGCYYNSYYKYPHIYKGYVSTKVMTWKNYSGDIFADYANSNITSFSWYTNNDDYIFN